MWFGGRTWRARCGSRIWALSSWIARTRHCRSTAPASSPPSPCCSSTPDGTSAWTHWPRPCGAARPRRDRRRRSTRTSGGCAGSWSRTAAAAPPPSCCCATPPATGCSPPPTRSTRCASPGWPTRPSPCSPTDSPNASCGAPTRRSHCGGAGPSPPSRTSRGPVPRSPGSRSCTPRCASGGSRRCSPWATPSAPWPISSRRSPPIRCASGCGPTACSPPTAAGAPSRPSRPSAEPASCCSTRSVSSPVRSCGSCRPGSWPRTPRCSGPPAPPPGGSDRRRRRPTVRSRCTSRSGTPG